MPFTKCILDGNKRPLLVTQSSDGRHFELAISFDYVARDGRRFRAPIGAKSDGASTPPEVWAVFGVAWIPPFGSYWPAAFVHDGAYQNWLQAVDEKENVTLANLTKDQADELFKEMMEELGTGLLERSAIYEGVHEAGWRAFREDRQEAIPSP